MEDEKKINWLSLFIKIVIAFAFILIIVWLVSKLINRNNKKITTNGYLSRLYCVYFSIVLGENTHLKA